MARRLTWMMLSLAFSLGAQAQGLQDPTRPPLGLDSAVESTVLPSGPVLQVIRNLPGKRIAIISGQEVRVGSKLGEARVIQIEEDRVELRGPEGKQTLLLFPAVDKRTVVSKPDNTSPSHKSPAGDAKRKE